VKPPRPPIPRWRLLLYSLLSLLTALAAVTLLFERLERAAWLDTERPDDRVRHAPVNFLVEEDGLYHIRDPHLLPLSFPAEKAPGVTRLLFAGGSFMLGTPYVYAEGHDLGYGDIPNWVGAELRYRYPGLRFEILNVGAGSRASAGVREIVERLLVVRPDLLIVATGNNEGSLPATGFNDAMHRWILYRILKKNLLPEPDLGERPYLAPQDPDVADMEKTFRKNIDALAEAARRRNILLVLVALPINLRYDNPFPDPDPVRQDPAMQEGRRLFAAREYRRAAAAFLESPYQAWAAKYGADCLAALGKYEEARALYKISVQLNPLNRTRPSYNEIVRQAAAQPGVYLVDLEKYFEDSSPTGLPDPALFHDYCHLTWRGYALAAAQITAALIAHGLVGDADRPPRPQPELRVLIEQNGWTDLESYRPPDDGAEVWNN